MTGKPYPKLELPKLTTARETPKPVFQEHSTPPSLSAVRWHRSGTEDLKRKGLKAGKPESLQTLVFFGGAEGDRTPDLLNAIPIPTESLKGWLVVFSCIYY